MNFKINLCISLIFLILKSVHCYNEPDSKIKFLKNEKNVENLQNYNPQHLTSQSNPSHQPGHLTQPTQNHLMPQKQDNLPSQMQTNQSYQLNQPQPSNLMQHNNNHHLPQQPQPGHLMPQQQSNFAQQQSNLLQPQQAQLAPQPDNLLNQQNFPQQQNAMPHQNFLLDQSPILEPSLKKNSDSLIDNQSNDSNLPNNNIKGRTLGLGNAIACDLNNRTKKMSNSSIKNCNQENGNFSKENLLKNNQLKTNLINQNSSFISNQFETNEFNLSKSIKYLIKENISLPIIFEKDYTLSLYTDPIYIIKKIAETKKAQNKTNNTNKFRSLNLDNNENPNNNLPSNFLTAKLNVLGKIKSAKLGIINSVLGLNSFGVKEALTSTTCLSSGLDTFFSSSSLKISLLCMTTVCIPSATVDIINNNEFIQCSLSCLTDPKSAVALFVYKNFNGLTETLNFKKQTITNLQSILTTDLVVEGLTKSGSGLTQSQITELETFKKTIISKTTTASTSTQQFSSQSQSFAGQSFSGQSFPLG